MDAEIQATGLIESPRPQDTDLPEAGSGGPNQPGAATGPADAAEKEAAPADGERLRLARELHDTIASAIAVIAIQAGVADHALERCQAEPQRAREALRAIRAASLQALDELQATVTTLRGKAAVRRPAPGVARLEALTNVLRHAGSATATVRLTYRERALTVQVDDDGAGAGGRRPSGGGNGLVGMGERLAALGGRLEAGPRPGGGFRVVATMPLDGAAKASPTGARSAPGHR